MIIMARIAFFEIKPNERAFFKRALKSHTLDFFTEPLDAGNGEWATHADAVVVSIYSEVTASTIKDLQKAKVIATRSTGFDHIDLAACKKRKIAVCNVPFYGENTVAEHTFALILSLSRNIHKSYVRTLRDDYSIEGLTGFDLKGKTIGIIGGGHIGMHVARMAKGFGMDVLVVDLHRNHFLAEVVGFAYADLEETLKRSDIVTLHVPYNKHTHHIINKENIRTLKKDAILINTGRGALVDTDALFEALTKKRLGGAGLDVIEGEEYIKEEKQLLHDSSNIERWKTIVRDHKIFKMDNVVFTPHNAFNSKEAIHRILETTIDNIRSALDGKPKYTVSQ
jgi:D-lactate dehydrogenase